MKTKALLLLSVVLVTSACVTSRGKTNDLEMGMSPAQVKAIMGEPDSTKASKDQGLCYMYSLWRDFWNRRPGDYSDRYYACFMKDKLVSYGRLGDR